MKKILLAVALAAISLCAPSISYAQTPSIHFDLYDPITGERASMYNAIAGKDYSLLLYFSGTALVEPDPELNLVALDDTSKAWCGWSAAPVVPGSVPNPGCSLSVKRAPDIGTARAFTVKWATAGTLYMFARMSYAAGQYTSFTHGSYADAAGVPTPPMPTATAPQPTATAAVPPTVVTGKFSCQCECDLP